jgi:cytochrome oxidase Cu insertion factor (SCO1/SenC/PrrC family)
MRTGAMVTPLVSMLLGSSPFGEVPRREVSSQGRRSVVSAKGPRFSTPLLVASLLALMFGLGATIAVSRLVSRPTIAAAPAAAQYLPPIGQQPVTAPDFTLDDQTGTAVSLVALRGQEVLVTFMDPQCTAQCPIVGQELGSVEARLPAGVKPVLLIVSVAPGRTPADVSKFVSHVTWTPGWHWLLGNQAQLQAVWAMYHIAVQPTTGDVLHDETVYVIDPQGRIRVGYNAPLPIAEVAAAITSHSSR